MSEITKWVGQRIRNYRVRSKLSQEQLAERSGCHPTYIGQVERGEKNATLESIAKIAAALDVPLSQLFEKLEDIGLQREGENIPLTCYEILASKSEVEQAQLLLVLLAVEEYKRM